MVYNSTANANGIIQLVERYTDLGSTYISGNTDRLKEFTSYAEEVGNLIWCSVARTMGGWQWDDSNNTDLPQATTNVVSGTNRYALPSDALTVNRVEIKDANGSTIKLTPYLREREQLSLAQMEEQVGTPTHYFVLNDTLQLYPKPDYNSTGGLSCYFDRANVSFTYDDTTQVPGIASPFHGLYPLGMAIKWLEIKQPNSPSLAVFKQNFAELMDKMEDYYANRWKDNSPLKINTKTENFE